MIITCPNCSTQFAVPAKAIPETGRTVKCSSCATKWHQDPVRLNEEQKQAEPPPSETKPVPEGGNLPVQVEQVGNVFWFKLTSAISLIAIAVSAVFYFHYSFSFLNPLYELVGLHDTRGLGFAQVEIDSNVFNNNYEFKIGTAVVNQGDEPRYVPPIRITVFDRDGYEMGSLKYPVGEGVLDTGDVAYISPEITNISNEAKNLVLDIGGPMEIWFR